MTQAKKSSPNLFLLGLRSIVFFIFQVTTLFIFAPLVLLSFPFSYSVRYAIASTWAKLVIKGLKTICKLDFKVTGAENIKGNGIIFCKHQSAWETFALQVMFPQQCWVLKKELLWIPLFGWALALTQPIAINRSKKSQSFKQIIEQGTDRLTSGRWVVIFPEGTRTAPGEKKKYMIGGALLAEKSGYPVIPVAHNAGEFWKRNAFIKYPGTIQVRIGEMVDSKTLSARELNQTMQNWIEGQMDLISNKAP
ncbi:MAG: 1-acyl-sn-glycerol-3-phosphate acyltransferase [Cycloclasticus sp.]|nr:1-acyl-sn-glycerol-3-phosphate acyltransferase [Cycloclasticus sp.]MBG95865.1 1-acyl-sn-glycerol-3-phosphate acyltransferase [Cycloclasticus sp.]HAI97777.1 1-acyl-sn-glycerol-3-phosphate acyltransferase [Methylococcaceae bacterium]|tara:strand:- start:2942 stop:3691 length:750 start_codon:yes stop_codon:yes gene_type:complete